VRQAALFFLLVTGFLLTATGGAVHFFLRRALHPISQLARQAARIGAGDLEAALPIPRDEELAALARAMERMRLDLKAVAGRLLGLSDRVLHSSDGVTHMAQAVSDANNEVSKVIQEVARGAEEMAAKTEETFRAMRQMSEEANQVTRTARGAVRSSDATTQVARQGGAGADEAVKRINEVQGTVLKSVEAIRGLKKESGRVGEIVTLISEIADQTNLLSLNAAIEAARVGAEGSGFAVLATEIRSLADKSAAAAKEIDGLIQAIQTGTDRAVEAILKSAGEMAQGQEAVAAAGRTLGDIVRSVESTAGEVGNISKTSEAMSRRSEEVMRRAEEMAAIAEESAAGTEEAASSFQETSASMQEVAAAAVELRETAQTLREIAGRFKVGPEADPPAAPKAAGRAAPPGKVAFEEGGGHGSKKISVGAGAGLDLGGRGAGR
jgi:methyl-accepting chemotaxis protein